MKISFYKYQGTGNDFIMLDNRKAQFDSLSVEQVKFLCDRKFGIGADGLIRINSKVGFDFEMDYFNADGTKSFCGNGARCSVQFAHFLGLISTETSFWAIDGAHHASIQSNQEIALRMKDVNEIKKVNSDWELNTGSPHYIRFVDEVKSTDVFSLGKQIRHREEYEPRGINVNFVEQIRENELFVRTYERGVEDETLSCGTGVTAAAIAYACWKNKSDLQQINIQTLGGKLQIRFELNKQQASNVFLIGPAIAVFSGEVELA